MKAGHKQPRIGLALGAGSARGWAHIGVIRELEQVGIQPHLVCGTSVGALVGAAYASGELARFEDWVLGLGVRDVLGFMDVSLSGGALKGERLMSFLRRHFTDRPVDQLRMPFGAVATSLQTGMEVWLRDGSTFDAVRASIGLPGLFAPVLRDDSVLVDGGLVNPVPVSLARAMGADVVIAVDLWADRIGQRPKAETMSETPSRAVADWMRKLQESLAEAIPIRSSDELAMPSMLDVLLSSLHIMQVRIARSRMAGEPPDVLITPRLAQMRLMDFHRAKEAIEEGRRAVARVVHSLTALI